MQQFQEVCGDKCYDCVAYVRCRTGYSGSLDKCAGKHKACPNPEGHAGGFAYSNSHTHPADCHVMYIESKDGSGSNAKYCIREGGWNGAADRRHRGSAGADQVAAW